MGRLGYFVFLVCFVYLVALVYLVYLVGQGEKSATGGNRATRDGLVWSIRSVSLAES
jgi:hypothetical protein